MDATELGLRDLLSSGDRWTEVRHAISTVFLKSPCKPLDIPTNRSKKKTKPKTKPTGFPASISPSTSWMPCAAQA